MISEPQGFNETDGSRNMQNVADAYSMKYGEVKVPNHNNSPH